VAVAAVAAAVCANRRFTLTQTQPSQLVLAVRLIVATHQAALLAVHPSSED
jgi:hypothetical protein